MTDIFFPLLALLGTLAATRASLGAGMSAAVGIGYVNGVVRANFLSIWTTFMFDAAILGLYIGFFSRTNSWTVWRTPLGKWVTALMVWPTLMCLIPLNHPLVQLVALRGTIWYLPVALIATRMRAADLNLFARVLAGLNLFSLVAGYYIYNNGLESLYPENAVTELMYRSRDVAGGNHRIPSTFLNAHSYGGTMSLSLAFLIGRLLQPRVPIVEKVWLVVGVASALVGVLMCAARLPIATSILTLLMAWILSGFSLRLTIVLAFIAMSGIYLTVNNERFQRAETLNDSEYLEARFQVSANDNFLDLLESYPFGAGMGSSVGTSIPFFLADHAPKQVGMENEYSRILVDQGWIGIVLWLSFLVWLYSRFPRAGGRWRIGIILMFSNSFITWATAFLGSGSLSAVPGSVIMLVQMGVLARNRKH